MSPRDRPPRQGGCRPTNSRTGTCLYNWRTILLAWRTYASAGRTRRHPSSVQMTQSWHELLLNFRSIRVFFFIVFVVRSDFRFRSLPSSSLTLSGDKRDTISCVHSDFIALPEKTAMVLNCHGRLSNHLQGLLVGWQSAPVLMARSTDDRYDVTLVHSTRSCQRNFLGHWY